MKNIRFLGLLGLLICFQAHLVAAGPIAEAKQHVIPIGGNAWVENGGIITDAGLEEWSDKQTICHVFVRVEQAGSFKLSLFFVPQKDKSQIQVRILNKSKKVWIGGDQKKEFYVGEWPIKKAGYISIEIRGLSKSGAFFGLLSAVGVSGTACSPDIAFVKNNEDNYFYWGRRGPSVHLNYLAQGLDSIEWFYNEITVPAGNDVIGSFFMANGFGEGYFGMQVNSEEERRILFSVWSPYETDNPEAIPEDYKIKALKKGQDVYLGEFGNEGSGGQSYLKYNWKAGNTYKFLLHGQPLDDNATNYTAYFFAPEENKWRLIASFRRPHTFTYLKHLHSFLENFIPETGHIPRMAFYQNQWALGANGKWTPLNEVKFTADNTARKNFRKDYAGGVLDDKFYLKNCGFFNDFTKINQEFIRTFQTVKPSTVLAEVLRIK